MRIESRLQVAKVGDVADSVSDVDSKLSKLLNQLGSLGILIYSRTRKEKNVFTASIGNPASNSSSNSSKSSRNDISCIFGKSIIRVWPFPNRHDGIVRDFNYHLPRTFPTLN